MDPGDLPEGPPSEEELRGAQALREALEQSGPEAGWLSAHLRVPTWDDSLGDLRARALARSAREVAQARRAAQAARPALPSWQKVRRAVIVTGGLTAAAALLLVLSSVLLEHGRPGPAAPPPLSAALLRASFQPKESPSRRLDLLIEERLQAVRQSGYRTGRTGARLLACGGVR
jgi:hypothetical protein